MKTDLVLNMDEYLREIYVVPRRIVPPSGNARHLTITTEGDLNSEKKGSDRRCDRWGHPLVSTGFESDMAGGLKKR
jgi:hypothetical protein